MRCHVGRQATEVARWWSLHEDLHAATQALDELARQLHVATQVPAQLVGLAAACERWWKLVRRGFGSGPAGVLGEGLAGWPGKGLAVVCCRPRQGPCRGSGGLPRQGSCRESSSSNPHLILNMSSQRSACHHRGAFPSPGPTWMMALGTVGSRVARSVGVGRAAPARVLPGEPARPSTLCGLGLGVALIILGFGLTLAHLPCSTWCDRGCGSDCPCTGKGVQKCAPLFVHRHEPSGLGHT